MAQYIDNQRGYWDSVADAKSFTHTLDLSLFGTHVPPDSRILDYGCGYGRTVARLVQEGYTGVIGVDLSTRMIKRGRHENPGLDLRVLPDGQIPFEDASFDAVILLAVLTCIPTNTGQRRLIRELQRLLSRDGIIYISDYGLQDDERNRGRYEAFLHEFGTYGIFRHSEGVVLRHHSSEWIDPLLSDFETLDYRTVEVPTMNGNAARVFQFMGRLREV